jgi:hypothetical protein
VAERTLASGAQVTIRERDAALLERLADRMDPS